MFSVTLSVAFRPPAFHWYPSLRSPDFPLPNKSAAVARFPKKNYCAAVRRLRRDVVDGIAASASSLSGQ